MENEINKLDETFGCHAAKTLLIPIVIDKNDNYVDVTELATNSTEALREKRISARRNSKNNNHDFWCGFCHRPVVPRFSGNQVGFHFAHYYPGDNKYCVDTSLSPDQYKSEKYKKQEGMEHIKTKKMGL